MYFNEPTNFRLNPHCFLNQKRDLPSPPPGTCLTDNKLARIWTYKRTYLQQIYINLRKGISPGTMARTQFPFLLPTAFKPPGLHIEFTNYCDLRCTYCPSPLNWRQKGWMDERTFSRLLSEIHTIGIKRVYMVGNGETTLHPDFAKYVRELSESKAVLSLTSNWQRIDEVIIQSILEASIDLLTISVDGKDAQSYESSRLRGSFERLLNNLRKLRQSRRPNPKRLKVTIRVMLRPSQESQRKEICDFWWKFADNVEVQRVVDETGTGEDVYGIDVIAGRFPRCSLTFKQLNVHWNGEVPLCTYATRQADDAQTAYLGNINTDTIIELWNHKLIRKYRHAHRKRIEEDMPLCNGCGGC